MPNRETYFTHLAGFSWSAMRFRITAGIMFIIFILFIIIAHVAISEQRTRMLQQVETYGADVTRFIAQISIVPLKKFNIYYLENYAFQFEQGELIAFCHIYDEKDNLLTAEAGDVAGTIEASEQDTTPPVLTFTADIVENGIHYGRVDVGLYVGSVYSNINKTSFYIILAFCVAVVVIGGAVSFFIHKQFVQPILNLSKTTRTIAEGQFVTSDISLRKDEIGELAGAINLMSGNLEDSYRTLEKNVDERTAELFHAKNMAEKSNRRLQIVGEEVQALLDNSPVGIVFVTNDYKILRVNREFFRITGYESEEIVGQSTRILHKDSHSFDEFISSSNQLDNDGLFNKKTELQKKDGLIMSCAVRGRKTILAGGAQGIVLNFEDITSRLLIEEELLKIRKLESVGVLARGIAHDFNNILVAILGNLSLIERFTKNDKQVGKLLSEARKASLRAKDLTEKLLTFAKGSEPDVKIGKLSDILRKAVPIALVGSTISSDYDIEDGLWKVKVDKSQIDSVVQSIVLNAKESMDDGEGLIRICCRNQELSEGDIATLTKGHYVKITVSDTGSGIDSSVIDKIFDPYFSTKEKDSNKGSGLGLSIVRSILVKHKGAIFLESEPGKGSLVSVYLPAVAEAVLQKEPEQILPSGKGVVVVADEDPAVHELTEEMLLYLGYQYVACYSLEDIVQEVEGVDRAGQDNVIVLIASTLIGDMAKQKTIDMFNSLATNIRYIVCHEEDPSASIDEYFASGFDNDLRKPFQLLELSRVLSSTTKRV